MAALSFPSRRVLGIIGGTGPYATAHVHTLVIEAAQNLGAQADGDFPDIWVANVPLPHTTPRGFADAHRDQVCERFAKTAAELVSVGADVLLPACNTLDEACDLPLPAPTVRLPHAAADEASRRGLTRVGVLGSRTSHRRGVHSRALADVGIECLAVDDDQQAVLDGVIAQVMAGRHGDIERRQLRVIADELTAVGAQAVLVGCTELSVLSEPDMLDAAAIAAKTALNALEAPVCV